MDVLWTRQALRSLESIGDYIARDNPQAAYAVTEAIRRTALLLGDFPQLGRTGRRGGTRERLVTGLPYVLIYRLRGAAVEILDVFHTSRRFPPEV
jgi:addiction module RelE/StbE family toxin